MQIPIDCDLDSLIESAPDVVHSARGQLTAFDRMLYFWAAKEFFSGQGTVVDAGALVGGSTSVLAEGLLANPRARADKPIIHVYDLFEDERDGYSATLLKGWYNDRNERSNPYDFLRHFKRNTKAYEQLIYVHKGDITKSAYDDVRAIEILSIDVAKSADLMLFCAKYFFPKLLPGQSMILHQDYIFPYQPWLHIAMELMADIVEKVYDVPNHCTAAFIPKRAITEKDVEARLGSGGADFYHIGNAKYLYRAIERARPGFGRFVHTAALVYFYATMGRRKTAIHVARRMLDEFDPSPTVIETAALGRFLQDDLGINYQTRGKYQMDGGQKRRASPIRPLRALLRRYGITRSRLRALTTR